MTDSQHTTRAFLDVSTSATGRRWIGPSIEDDRQSEAMAQATDLPLPVCRTLVRRGVAAQDAAAFLAPTLRDLMPNPRSLLDMETAAARIVAATQSPEKIAIFADYDVDGGTSAALLIDWLRGFGKSPYLRRLRNLITWPNCSCSRC